MEYFQHKQEEEKLTQKDQIDVIVSVKNDLKIPVSDDYVYQITGIPKPDDYDEQKEQMNAAALAMQNNLNKGSESNPNDKEGNKPTKKATNAAQKKLMADFIHLMQDDSFKTTMASFFEPAP